MQSTSVLSTTIGKTIRRLRHERGLVLRDVEHISMAHLSEIERGRKEASSVMIETIAKSLHLSTADLLKEVYEELERGSKWESKTL